MNKISIYNAIKILSQKNSVCIITVSGDSMLPTLKNGDIVKILSSSNMSLDVGDIVYSSVYADHGVIHRIHNIFKVGDKLMFQTKGDNNRSPDPYYLFRQGIIGKMID